MSLSLAETFLRNARDQHAQIDINASLLKALYELTNEIRRLENELHRIKRDVQVARRF
jgi:transposase